MTDLEKLKIAAWDALQAFDAVMRQNDRERVSQAKITRARNKWERARGAVFEAESKQVFQKVTR